MRFRSIFLIAFGVALGMKLAAKLREDDPDVVHGPQRAYTDQRRPALRLVSDGLQRATDAATDKSLQAIRRLRTGIRDRLGEDDAAAWN
jgi:hypothetical protein